MKVGVDPPTTHRTDAIPHEASVRLLPEVLVPARRRTTPVPPDMVIVVELLLLTITKLSPGLKMLALIVTLLLT